MSHMRDDHHLADYEIQVLLALAGKRPPLRWGAALGQCLETLSGFGFATRTSEGFELTPEGRQLAEELAASR